MKQRKIPLRTSVVTGEVIPKKQLLRITRSKEGVVSIDPTGKMPGRGAYIAMEPQENSHVHICCVNLLGKNASLIKNLV